MKHQVVDDIETWLLFRRRAGDLYIVGSRYGDNYLVVPKNKLSAVQEVVSLFDGEHDIEDLLKDDPKAKYTGKQIGDLFLRLREAGLVKTAKVSKKAASEVLQHSIMLFQVPVERAFSYVTTAAEIFRPWVMLFSLLVCAVLLRHFSMDRLGSVLVKAAPVVEVRDILFFWLGFIAIAILHECAHGLAAKRCGLNPSKLNVALYLAFIPYIYLQIPGIYTLPPKRRLLVWSAGIYVNVLLVAILWLVLQWCPTGTVSAAIMAKLIWANLSIIIFNLSPLMATDGYFLLSTLLKTPNIRTNAYLEFKKWAQRKHNHFTWPLAVYFTASSFVIAVMLLRTIESGYGAVAGVVNSGFSLRSLVDLWPFILVLVPLVLQRIWKVYGKVEPCAAQQ